MQVGATHLWNSICVVILADRNDCLLQVRETFSRLMLHTQLLCGRFECKAMRILSRAGVALHEDDRSQGEACQIPALQRFA